MRPRHCDAFNIKHGMEQTSMTNAIKKRLNRKGFTLAEVLVTVAIIIILAGVTFVSVAQYQKNLRLMEMDGTAKEIFIAAQNHLSVAQASGDLDRLAGKANRSADGVTKSAIGTKLASAPSYAGNASGEYYYVIHDVNSGSESYTPAGSEAILQMMLPFGALDETVATGGNYAIVYELKSASVVAVLYSGAGNASFGNAAVINLEAEDVSNIENIYNDKSARKNYQKGGVTAIVGCYTGTAGSAAIPTETLEAPKLEVKNENKLHVIVRGNYSAKDVITLTIHGVQSNTTAIMQLNCTDNGSNEFDITLDDITSDSTRFTNILSSGRFTRSNETPGTAFIPGENIEISATARATDALATPKTSAVYTTSSLFADVNDGRTVYIQNLRHLENLSVDMSDFAGNLTDKSGTTNGDITAIQKNDITMLSWDGLTSAHSLYGAGTLKDTYVAVNVNYPLSYDGGRHEIYGLSIAPYLNSSDQATHNAGIFGNVTATLSVKNLILRNDKIPVHASGEKALSTDAGMLLGKTSANLTVDGVLAYYHETEYNEANDSAVEVQASQVAGGLIGLVAGGRLEVKNSAAAVYVKGGSAAGGLIGSADGAADGSTIVQSYAGGHTRDGAYDTEVEGSAPKNQGAGRYNVQASGYAGGFIGVTSNNVRINAVYSTASAYSEDPAKSGSFSGNMKANFGTANNYYAIGPHNGTDASTDDTAKAEIKTGQVRRQATPYDRKRILKAFETEHTTMDKTSYPLCTVLNLCEVDTSVKDADLPWFIKEHVGDWVVKKKDGNLIIKNGADDVRLELDYSTSDTSSKMILFRIEGVQSKEKIDFVMRVAKDNPLTYDPLLYVQEGNGWLDTFWIKDKIKVEKDGAGYKYKFYLDDITTTQGHFAFLTSMKPFILGEDLNITVSECTLKNGGDNRFIGGYDQKVIETKTVNSLYDHVVGDTAYISNARHLENLDERVSGINKKNSVKITNAVLMNDILWKKQLGTNVAEEDGFVEKIKSTTIDPAYKDRSSVCTYNNGVVTKDGCFVPITNSKLQSFDGAGHTLTNMDIYWLNDGDHHTGLFGQVRIDLDVKNLTLHQVRSICASEASSAAVIGKVETDSLQTEVKLQNITISGECTAEGDASGSKSSGGLIGEVAGENTSVVIDDIKIRDGNLSVRSKQDWGGYAGGIIGYVDKSSSTTLQNVHIVSPLSVNGGEFAGGFIGKSNATTGIANCSIESANVNTVYKYAGGLIGEAAMATTMDHVTVKNIRVHGGQQNDTAIGGAIGITRGNTTLKNITVQNANVTSQTGKAGGLIGEATSEAVNVNINATHLDGSTSVSGINHAGGMIGYADCNAYLENVSIARGEIKASFTNNYPNDRSVGGFIGFVSGSTTEEKPAETNVEQKVAVSKAVIFGNLKVEAEEGNNYSMNLEGGVGGVIGYGGASVAIDGVTSTGCITVSALGERAGGVLGTAREAVSIKNIQFEGPLTVSGHKEVGGLTGGNVNKEIKIANAALLSDALIVSSEGDAGGVIGHAKNGVIITNTKVAGANTEILAGSGSGNAGGLIGGFENSLLTINNSAVSAFVDAEDGNAGGLIGLMNDQTSGSKIENSYYGGRTKAGAYSVLTVHGRSYETNIMAKYSAGGLIGSVGNQPCLTINNCYSTGSVKTKEGSVGGLIGYIGNIEEKNKNMSLNQCYSMGKVLNASNVEGRTGGFIGKIEKEEPEYENVYYLNAFDLSSVNAVGTLGNSKKSKITVIKDPSQILGKPESHDLTTIDNTKNYDETLNDQAYPYKNWTKSGENANDPIEYYGDWPLPNKQLNGRIVYYHQLSGDKSGGEFTLTGYDTSLTTTLYNPKGNFEADGFGIICETPNREDANKKFWYSYSLHNSNADNDGYTMLSPEGSNNNVECSSLVLEGKTYYFFRLTKIDFKKLENTTIYFKGGDDTIYANIIYRATINKEAHTVTFDRVE